ncbi:MAG TPA: hypothetical protein VGJ73_13070 [Verrucomicrobiae bacterium]|jgi:hypothetical protein
MTLDQTFEEIKACTSHMDSRYGNTVFDEWAIVSLVENKARVLAYVGPRNDEFLQNFVKDLGVLRAELRADKYSVGDFEFNRHGVGTGHEVFMVLGSGLYLICNNTHESMDSIAKNPRWLNAQVSFAELSDRIRSNPLTVSGDNTRFLKKPLI